MTTPPATITAAAQTGRHVVCVPYPAQGHINPMLQLAKLLYSHGGFHITFVNTEYNHRRLLKSRPAFLDSLPPGFNFEAIPDGLPPSDDPDATQDIPSLSESTSKTCLGPFRDLVLKLNDVAASSSSSSPALSCIVSDGSMTFTLEVAKELGIPEALFWTPSACGVLAYANYHLLTERGLFPLKDSSYLTNGYLETLVDFIPGMSNNIRLKDLPSFLRTTNLNDIMFNFVQNETSKLPQGTAFLLNTFDSLEKDVLAALSPLSPNLLTIGPLNLLLRQVDIGDKLNNINTNLWTEHSECIEWLDSQQPESVLYVNFGSITVINHDQMSEFAWGLARSEKPFLWVIRPDLVSGQSATLLPPEFVDETKGRGLLVPWCSQEQILNHRAIAGFLSHMGWNSTIESLTYGVPMICWPFFAEQQTNYFYACNEWGVGVEINSDVKKEEVEKLVREVIGGEKGKEMKRRAIEWKKKAEEATKPGGMSYQNMKKLIELLS